MMVNEPTGIELKVCEDIARRQTKWTLLKPVSGGKHPKWLAKCECGKEKEVYIENIQRGKSISCGCHRKVVTSLRTTKHGQSGKTKVYRTWTHMKGRCLNPNDAAYHDYGGRGIKICERWLVFENFYADMGDPSAGQSIERKNVNGNYEPENCIWIDKKLQARNKRDNRFTAEMVMQIRDRLSKGEATSLIAKEFGCSTGHIRQIKRQEIWEGV
jgi:hypothetical protein